MKTISIAALALMLVLAGCATEEPIDRGGEGMEDDVTVVMSLKLPGGAATRGLSATQEGAVNTVDVFVFDKDLQFTDWQYGQLENNSGILSFSAILKASKASEDKFRILVLANARNLTYSLFNGANFNGHKGETYAQIRALLQGAVPTYADLSAKGIPMWGELENMILLNKNTGNNYNMDLLRSLARIDVGTHPSPTYAATGQITGWSALTNFSVEGVYVYKAGTTYAAATDRSHYSYTSKGVSAVSLPSPNTKTSTPTVYSDSQLAGTVTRNSGKGVSITGNVYTGESNVIMGGTYGDSNHLNRMAVVVAGYYSPNPATPNTTTLSYYRLDFLEGTSSTVLMDVLRNHDYQIVIRSVNGPGQTTADLAYESMNADISATILTWSGAGQGSTVIDGQYYLKVSEYDLKYEKWPSTNERFTINTNVAATGGVSWTAVVAGLNPSDQANWLQLRNVTTGGVVSSLSGVDGGQIRLSVTEFPAGAPNDPRVGYIRITAGSMKFDVRVEQRSTDNAFLRLSNSEFIFSGRKLANAQGLTWSAPDVQTLQISYGPEGFNYTMSLTPFSGGGISGFTPVTPSSATSVNIQPSAINPSDAEVIANPFYERSSKLNIAVRNYNNTATITKQVSLRQIYYSLLVTGMYDYYFQNNTYTLTLRANSPWTATITGDAVLDPLVAPATSGSGNTTTGEAFTFKIKSNATPGQSATVTFRSPNNLFPEQVFVINAQDALPNSYIVAPSATSDPIKVRKAYRVWKLDHDLKGPHPNGDLPSGAASVALLWQDAPNLIASVSALSGTGEAATFTVTAGSGSGNAVVAYMIGSTIYWSWHIWVTGDTMASIPSNGYGVMDRHVGALSATPQSGGNLQMMGLLYQAGRKDPFSPATSYTNAALKNIYPLSGTTPLTNGVNGLMNTITPPDMNLGGAINNPMTIYRGTYGHVHWYGQLVDPRNGLWDYNYKTDYDPCPIGWRVLTDAVGDLTTQSRSNMCYLWKGAYYPAQGLLPFTATGYTTIDQGATASFWKIQTDSSLMGRGFVSGGTTLTGRQTSGIPVRCMLE